MKKMLVGVSLGAIVSAMASVGSAGAADLYTKASAAPQACDPYVKYSCLDTYLGDNVFERFYRYYVLEWGHDAAPADPKAPPSRRADWPTTPQTIPPYPFSEWPYGGATNLGVTRPSSTDSPLMVAIANTAVGQAMNDAHIQLYGWVNAGGNISSNTTKPGGNWPAAYAYTPNTVQLDQAVVYLERLPDTVQKDHVDWGFRLSAIYGENYRYTTAFGIASYQLLNKNNVYGYDFPMYYGELFFPQVMDGLLVRVGRYISIPDIEAQLAPNNYMYTHSMTYTFDNYTNHGIQSTLAVTKNWFFQLGVSIGTEAPPWHWGKTIPNPFPNPVFPGTTMLADPGAKPSLAAGVRYQSDSGNDNVYIVADGINNGTWGYNNLQWTGITWYHKFDDKWHFSWEMYTLDQKNVLNAADPAGIIANGGFPWASYPYNTPSFAQCKDPTVLTCTARSYATVMYVNYRLSSLDNISFRPEYYNDRDGQRTGVKTRYYDFGLGWQHWFSPQFEIRPEVTYYHSVDKPAFNGNFNGDGFGVNAVAPNKNSMWMLAMDAIIHF